MGSKITPEEEVKINPRKVTEDHQEKRRKNELDDKRRTKIIFFGNRGVGKSTLASIFLHPEEGFETEVDETGFTQAVNEKQHPTHPYTVIDTPALVDSAKEKNRKVLGLQRDGKYKILFVATTTQSGLRPEDSAALSHLTKTIKEISSENGIALIVNKVPESLQESWENAIPEISGIGNNSDLVSEIPEKTLENLKQILKNAIDKCPITMISRENVESRKLRGSPIEKMITPFFNLFRVKDNSKNLIEPPDHEDIEPVKKKVKLNPKDESSRVKEKVEKGTPSTEISEKEVDMLEEMSQPFDEVQRKDNNRHRQKKCSLIQEQYENYKKMPQCFEKSLISLLYYTTMQSSDLKSNTGSTVNSDKMIDKEFELLKLSAKTEERESDSLIKSLEKIQLTKVRKDWKEQTEELEKLLKDMRSLDIKYMMSLFQEVNEAAKSIKGQHVFLLLGGTGVGKSTLTHFLAGSKMGHQKIEGFTHIGPIGEIKNPDLKHVISSPFTTSETRYITPVKIDFKRETIILCDSPGFEDTNGPEVDIANSFGIVTAVQGCKSVKPIILLSSMSGDRFQKLKEMAHILVGMMPSVKRHLSSFSYIFTKFSPEKLKEIPSILNDIMKNFKSEELADECFRTLIDDMLEKVTNGRRGPIAIDVLNDDPKEILGYLKLTASIQYPDEVFKVSISPQSKSALQEQVRKHELTIISASKRADFALVKYKMDELKEMNEVLHQDFIQNVYEECVRLLTKTVNQNYHDAVEFFTQRLTSKNPLTKDDLLKYQDFMKSAVKAELLREYHLGRDTVSSGAYENKVTNEIETLCSELSSSSLDHIMRIQEIADKAKLVSDSFLSLDSKYKNLLNEMSEMIKTSYGSFEEATKNKDFERSGKELQQLCSAQQSLSGHLSPRILEKYEAAQLYFQNMLKEESSRFDYLFKKGAFSEEDVTKISHVVNMMVSAEKTYTLQPHIPVETIKQNSNSLIKKVEDFISQRIDKIERCLKENGKNNLGCLEAEFSQITLLRRVPIVESNTSESYHSLLTKLCNTVQDIRIDIQNTLLNIFKEGEANYKKLNHSLNHLKSAEWIQNYREGLYQEIIDEVQNQITQHLSHFQKIVQGANLQFLDNHSQLIPTWKKVCEALNMKSLSGTIPDVSKGVEAIVKAFTDATEVAFSQIEKDYDPENLKEGIQKIIFDTSKTDHTINYLEISKTTSMISSKRDKAVQYFSEFMTKYSKLLQDEFHQLISDVINYDQNGFSRADISQKVLNIFKILCDVDEIYKGKKAVIYDKYFPKSVKNWKNALDELKRDLVSKLDEAIQLKTADIANWLCIAKILGKLDEFVLGPQKFSDIFCSYSQKHCENTYQIHGKLIGDLTHYKYPDAALEMESLKTKKDTLSVSSFQKIVHCFNSSLTDLIESAQNKIIMLPRQLEQSELQGIQKELKCIETATKLMKEYIKAPEEVDRFMEYAKTTLSSKILSYIKGITFVEAETKLFHAESVKQLLPSYLSDDVHEKLNSLIDQQNTHVEEMITEYTQMEPENYTLKPPIYILKKLEEAAVAGNNSIYVTAQEKIKSAIKLKLDALLAESRPHAKGTKSLRQLESILEYLPSDMKSIYKFKVETSKADFVNAKTELQVRLRNEMTSEHKDLRNLKQIYADSLEIGDDSSVMEVRGFIKGEVRKCVDRLKHQFQECKINETIDSLKLLYDYNTVFGKDLTEISGILQRAKDTFSTRIDEVFSNLIISVQRSDMSEIPEEIVRLSESRYGDAVSIISFNKKFKMDSSYRELIFSDLDSKFIQMSKTIIRRIISITETFNEGFEKIDAHMLNSSLVAIEKWISLSERIKSFHANEYEPCLDLDDLVKDLPDRNNIIQMKERITSVFVDFQKDITKKSNWVIDPSNFCKIKVDEHYQKLNDKFSLLKHSPECQFSGSRINPEKLLRECSDFVERKVLDINSRAQTLLNQILNNLSSESREFVACFGHLCSISEKLEIKGSLSIEAMKDQILEKGSRLEQECNDSIQDIKKFSDSLKLLKSLALKTDILKEKIDYKIDTLLTTYKMTSKNDKGLAKLGTILNSDMIGIGQLIIGDHKCFGGYKNSIFVHRTNKYGMDDILLKLTGDNFNRERLRKRYTRFFEHYDELVQENLKPNLNLAPLIAKTTMVLGHFDQKKDNILWNSSITDNIPSLMAHIFAIWTLQNATYYFEAQGLEDQGNYLLKPHAGQIISIFRML